ncbi:MAG: diadenylate cyclase [Anaerolineae bacterium]|jgi:DNA integrity scanning protein DisA with diadenylate cyclase activity
MMSHSNGSEKQVRTNAELATMVARVSEAATADAILGITESGSFARHLVDLAVPPRLIAATSNQETLRALVELGLETLCLPLYSADKYSQVRHALSVALRAGRVAIGHLVVCAVGCNVYPKEGDLVVLTDVDPGMERLAITDLLRLTDGIRPQALEAALTVASRIGQVVRRGGTRVGAIFILGDSINVLKGSKQLVPNPFHGHQDSLRRITNPDIHDALIELSKLDGAFVVRGDGYIQSAAVFLATSGSETEQLSGLGARHIAAASITARTAATAIVVSATDGNVRAFAGGQLVLQLDPLVPYSPTTMDA